MKRSINVCKHCGIAIPYGEKGMITHIRVKHPDVWDECFDCDAYENIEAVCPTCKSSGKKSEGE